METKSKARVSFHRESPPVRKADALPSSQQAGAHVSSALRPGSSAAHQGPHDGSLQESGLGKSCHGHATESTVSGRSRTVQSGGLWPERSKNESD